MRIREAVSDPDWIDFRKRLKGTPTDTKLTYLKSYYELRPHDLKEFYESLELELEHCKTCIQLDNYIKALCRGGQLKRGASLDKMINTDWSKDWIRK